MIVAGSLLRSQSASLARAAVQSPGNRRRPGRDGSAASGERIEAIPGRGLRPGQANVRRTLLNGLTRCQRESSFGVGELCDPLLLARLRKPSGSSPILRVGPHVRRDRPKAPVRKNWAGTSGSRCLPHGADSVVMVTQPFSAPRFSLPLISSPHSPGRSRSISNRRTPESAHNRDISRVCRSSPSPPLVQPSSPPPPFLTASDVTTI